MMLNNGTEPSKPKYVVPKSRIFDVTSGKLFHGLKLPSYAMFAGKEATPALAKMIKNKKGPSSGQDDQQGPRC